VTANSEVSIIPVPRPYFTIHISVINLDNTNKKGIIKDNKEDY